LFSGYKSQRTKGHGEEGETKKKTWRRNWQREQEGGRTRKQRGNHLGGGPVVRAWD